MTPANLDLSPARRLKDLEKRMTAVQSLLFVESVAILLLTLNLIALAI